MIAALVIAAILATAPVVEATFVLGEGFPPLVEVARLTRSATNGAWRIAEVRQVGVRSGHVTLAAPPGDQTLIVIRVAGRPGYLLHGPFGWPFFSSTFEVDTRWRRTVRGRSPQGGMLSWISPSADLPHVLCEWTLPGQWECLGVPRSVSGVVVSPGAAGVSYAVVRGGGPRNDVEDVTAASAAWGRLLVVQDLSAATIEMPAVHVRALRLYQPPARPNVTRFDSVPDGSIHIDTIWPGLWVTGTEPADGGWLELTVAGTGVARVAVADLSGPDPDAVVPIRLEGAMAVSGRVTAALATPVPDTVVALYRFGEQIRGAERDKPRRQRIAVAEQRTNGDGIFEFADLFPEAYEIVALHPAFGRAVRAIGPYESLIEIALRAPPMLQGRVLRDGVPQAGVAVAYAPDPATFAMSSDPTELRGGEGHTDANGRFRIAAAAAGPGELRIGSAGAGIKRIPVPPADTLPAVTDVGDIEFDAGIEISILFEEPGDCSPVLTGPVGRAGLTVVRSKRAGPAMFTATVPEPGRWNVVALCGSRERQLVPSGLEIKAGARESTIYVRWP